VVLKGGYVVLRLRDDNEWMVDVVRIRMCDLNLKIIHVHHVGVKIMFFVVVAFGGKAPRQDWSGWIQIKTVSFINFLLISQEYSVNLLEGTVHSRKN
jgi:hypothetical protein